MFMCVCLQPPPPLSKAALRQDGTTLIEHRVHGGVSEEGLQF